MYPYQTRTQPAPLQAKEKTEASQLSADHRLHELLHLAKQEAADTEQKYNAFCRKNC